MSEGGRNDEDELLSHAEKIFTPITLPSGRVVPNRLVKVPMYEHSAPLWGSSPHSGHIHLYSKWAAGKWGMIMTGNVQVAHDHLPLGRDMVVPETLTDVTLAPWRRLADTIHDDTLDPPATSKHSHALRHRPLAIVQLSHGGRQSLNFYSGRPLFAPPLAPSAIPVGQSHAGKHGWLSDLAHWLMLQVPREMTHADIQHAIAQFVRGAQMAAWSGWDGIQLHAAHGYLINQFISPKTNYRTDEYSAERDPLHFLRDIVAAIRAPGIVPDDFVIGVKLNSGDYERDGEGLQEHRALGHVREIGEWGLVDFIEVSGGDYEDPQFIDTVEQYKSPRQVIFESFAEKSIEILAGCTSATKRSPPLVLLTGGLNNLPRMSSVVEHDHAHLLGIARLSIIHPTLPVKLEQALAARCTDFLRTPPPAVTALGERPRSYLSLRALERMVCYMLTLIWMVVPARLPRIIGTSTSVNWYYVMMWRMAGGQGVDYTIGMIGATLRCYFSPTPYGPEESGATGEGYARWTRWTAVAFVGVAIGVGLGQVV